MIGEHLEPGKVRAVLRDVAHDDAQPPSPTFKVSDQFAHLLALTRIRPDEGLDDNRSLFETSRVGRPRRLTQKRREAADQSNGPDCAKSDQTEGAWIHDHDILGQVGGGVEFNIFIHVDRSRNRQYRPLATLWHDRRTRGQPIEPRTTTAGSNSPWDPIKTTARDSDCPHFVVVVRG